MEIYIVEDDRTVINILEDIIETNGLGTVCGTSGGQDRSTRAFQHCGVTARQRVSDSDRMESPRPNARSLIETSVTAPTCVPARTT